jgi:hypothetical protein
MEIPLYLKKRVTGKEIQPRQPKFKSTPNETRSAFLMNTGFTLRISLKGFFN